MVIGNSNEDEKQIIRSLPTPAKRMVFFIRPHQIHRPQISPCHKALNSESTSFLIVSPISSKGQVVDPQKRSVSSSVKTGQQVNPENMTRTSHATSVPPVSPFTNAGGQLPANIIFTSDGAPVSFVSSFVNTSALMAPRNIKMTSHITPGSSSTYRSHKTVPSIMTTSCATSVSPSLRHYDSNKSPLPEAQNISSNVIQTSGSFPIFSDTSTETCNENLQKSSCNTKVNSQNSSLPITLSSIGDNVSQEKSPVSVQLPTPETGSIRQFKCHVCGKMFNTNRGLSTHLKCHSDERPYQCPVCNMTFKTSSTLSNHKRTHFEEKKKHKCNICNYSSFDACCIVQHTKRHFRQYQFKCDTCGKGFYTKRELETHNNLHIGLRPFVCSDCGKSYTTQGNLKDHRKSQHEKKTLQCDKCNKLFAFKNALLRHIQSHTEESRFLCEVCGKALGSREALRRHHPVHSDEKPHMCATCGKAFRSRNYLITHQRVHTGEKPYQCEKCPKAFTQHSTLVIHRRYHSGDRPYKCHLCSKGFVSKTILKSHIANHNAP